jgi:hypothetical protein
MDGIFRDVDPERSGSDHQTVRLVVGRMAAG